MAKEEDVSKFIEKVNKLAKEKKLDLSSDEDLSIGIMNLISIEEHLFFTGNKTGNVNEFDRRGDNFFRFGHAGKFVEAFIRNGNNSDIWVDCSKRIILDVYLFVGQGLKEGTLSHIRKPDNTNG